ATGSWTACSRRIDRAELRCLKTVPLLGPAPRRSALRENRRLVSAERRRFTDKVRRGTLKKRVPRSAARQSPRLPFAFPLTEHVPVFVSPVVSPGHVKMGRFLMT